MLCPTMLQLIKDRDNAKTPKERVIILARMSNHKQDCDICSGKYHMAGAQQVRDQAFAGSWGNGK